jgi:glycosyltransferase involved in cell wall biosynthesis
MLKERLNAVVHEPDQTQVTAIDRWCARLVGQPEHWAMARKIASKVTRDDVVLCAGEDIGLTLAILFAVRGIQAKLVMTIMAPERFRSRVLTKVLNWVNPIRLFMTNTQQKADFLQQHLHLSNDRVFVYSEQTDAQFFTPKANRTIENTSLKQRPLIASAGLEQRDYRTLAAATEELEVDVRVCAVSPNASATTRVDFPEVMPPNMIARHYEWGELRELYQSADVVAVSLLYNHYSAGLTTLIEAIACCRPVVITRTPGLAERLIQMGVVRGVEAGDAEGLKQAISYLLEHPEVAAAQAQSAHDLFLKEFTSDQFVESIAAQICKLNAPEVLSPQGSTPRPNFGMELLMSMQKLRQLPGRFKPYFKRT